MSLPTKPDAGSVGLKVCAREKASRMIERERNDSENYEIHLHRLAAIQMKTFFVAASVLARYL